MTPSPDVPTKKSGMPAWAWGLIGCSLLLPVPIIAAILFPVFAQAREKARAISCLSNLKQQGMGLMMYVYDYDEKLPPKDAKWMDVLVPYTKQETVFHCPSLKGPGEYGYAISSEILGKKLEKIKEPAQTVSIFESTKTERNAKDGEPAYRHRNTTNRAFVDGHAKSVKEP